MIRRLRPLPSPDELARMYATPHDHRRYGRDHAERVDATVNLAKATLGPWYRDTIADLSCGNGAIAEALALDDTILVLGDLATTGPIEEQLLELAHVDLFICSETLEHLDDPFTVLAEIRKRADRLLLSTPVRCWGDGNPEHLFAWDREGVEAMLSESGWDPVAYEECDGTVYSPASYIFGIWVAR